MKDKGKIEVKILRTLFCRTPPGECFWYLENLTFKLLILTKFAHLINIFGKLYIDEEKRRFQDFYFTVYLLEEQLLAWKV